MDSGAARIQSVELGAACKVLRRLAPLTVLLARSLPRRDFLDRHEICHEWCKCSWLRGRPRQLGNGTGTQGEGSSRDAGSETAGTLQPVKESGVIGEVRAADCKFVRLADGSFASKRSRMERHKQWK